MGLGPGSDNLMTTASVRPCETVNLKAFSGRLLHMLSAATTCDSEVVCAIVLFTTVDP
jgi:hypothetical protein